ncbi:MAG: hypothetical protein AAB319_02095, partial [Pseudomonadota bacterium]
MHDTGLQSNEDNWGYKHIAVAFGIDTTKPKIEFELNNTTYYFGEDLLISNVIFSDNQGKIISGIGSYEVTITGNNITNTLIDENEELYGNPKGGKE